MEPLSLNHNLIIRRVIPDDADRISVLLNRIIDDGGWTAMTKRVFPEDQRRFISAFPKKGIFNVAIDHDGRLAGMQDVLPGQVQGTGNISTFVDLRYLRQGTGRKLWARTVEELKTTKIKKIQAVIRSDNVAGLRYYSSLGFQKVRSVESDSRNAFSRILYEWEHLPHSNV